MIFDCDGVLVDSRESNVRYYNLLRLLVDLPPMPARDEHFVHTATHEEAIARVIPAALLPNLRRAAAHVNYMRDVLPLLSPAAGLTECLDALRGKGIALGICTNRSESMFALLERFSLTGYFSQVMTADRAAPKPAPDGLLRILDAWGARGDEAVFVGDSHVDQQAAHNAGVRFWAFSAPELAAEHHVGNFSELRDIISIDAPCVL